MLHSLFCSSLIIDFLTKEHISPCSNMATNSLKLPVEAVDETRGMVGRKDGDRGGGGGVCQLLSPTIPE